jgi:hypothetical protein
LKVNQKFRKGDKILLMKNTRLLGEDYTRTFKVMTKGIVTEVNVMGTGIFMYKIYGYIKGKEFSGWTYGEYLQHEYIENLKRL